jgi:hypothetical protein
VANIPFSFFIIIFENYLAECKSYFDFLFFKISRFKREQ